MEIDFQPYCDATMRLDNYVESVLFHSYKRCTNNYSFRPFQTNINCTIFSANQVSFTFRF